MWCWGAVCGALSMSYSAMVVSLVSGASMVRVFYANEGRDVSGVWSPRLQSVIPWSMVCTCGFSHDGVTGAAWNSAER
jgi:hypothetical protein